MTPKEITAEILIDAIKQSNHFASKGADILGISRATFYNKLKQFPSAQQAWDDLREKRHDYVESKLLGLIEDGNVTAIIFYLKTQCKDRGYVERQEISDPEGKPIKFVEVVLNDGSGNSPA